MSLLLLNWTCGRVNRGWSNYSGMSLGSDQYVSGYDTISCGERTVAGHPNWLIQNQSDAKRREIG